MKKRRSGEESRGKYNGKMEKNGKLRKQRVGKGRQPEYEQRGARR